MNRPVPLARRVPSPIVASLLLPAFLTALGLPAPAMAQQGALPWRGPFESAWAEAASRGRPLWVQFSGSWCGYCVRMDLETFSRSDVVAYTFEEYVPVKVSADERPDLLARFGVSRLPATLLIAPDGRLLARRDGYTDPGTFLGLLASCRMPLPVPETIDTAPAPTYPEGELLALDGIDPVLLAGNHGLARGKADLAASRDGQTFRFASAENRDAFLADPERYLPRNGGRCLVSQVDAGAESRGDPRFGVAYGGHLYVFASDEARKRFAESPDRYASADLADNGYCPHCRATDGSEIPGRAPFVSTHNGKRYLFPDALHLQAFAADPERFVR